MEAQHTPGPWTIMEDRRSTSPGEREIDVISLDRPTFKVRVGTWLFRADQPTAGIANVRLIAAAPDMLVGYRELVAACRLLPASDGRVIGLLPLLERADDIIAKATT